MTDGEAVSYRPCIRISVNPSCWEPIADEPVPEPVPVHE
jgi:hypothetical protein